MSFPQRHTPPPFRLRDGGVFHFDRPRVMGVLNVTPDSFSDGGIFESASTAIAHGLAMREAGADLIDIGGESTRPGSLPVSPEEQCRRVLPVIAGLAKDGVLVSIDTTSAEVARRALDAGAEIINDISAFRFDPEMLRLLAERGCPAFAMHTLGPPSTMQREVHYDDVVCEVRAHLESRVAAAIAAGVLKTQLGLDPGIGFGKHLEHNLSLLRHTPTFGELGHPVLIGTSRKSFLGRITGRETNDRLMGTASSVALAVALGAHVVRVHDVPEMVDVVRVAHAIAMAN
jgi:dihydropteroate synthase